MSTEYPRENSDLSDPQWTALLALLFAGVALAGLIWAPPYSDSLLTAVMLGLLILGLLSFWASCAWWGYRVAIRKGRDGGLAVVLVLVLGLVGLAICYALSPGKSAPERAYNVVPPQPSPLPGGSLPPPIRRREPPGPSATLNELERLARLREAGHLTDGEFERLKAQLIR